ncbi:MAG: hypothetical protein ACT4PQ_15100 [Betaproteobacteria bacterium]
MTSKKSLCCARALAGLLPPVRFAARAARRRHGGARRIVGVKRAEFYYTEEHQLNLRRNIE